MARKTKEEAQKTREQLMLTALDLFAEKGVAQTTLTDISKQAGVTKGAFYWHFSNKLEIFEAISNELYKSVDDQAEKFLLGFDDPLLGIFTAIHYYAHTVEYSEQMQKALRLYFYKCEYTQDFAPFIKLDHEELDRSRVQVIEQLSKLDADAWVEQPFSLADIATALFDAITGALRRWIVEPTPNFAQQLDTTMRIILRGAGLNIASDAYLPEQTLANLEV